MVTDHHSWPQDRAGGGSPAGARAGQAGRPGRGRRRAAVAIMAAGAAALGAMLAVPASSGADGPGLAVATDAAFSSGTTGVAAPGGAAVPAAAVPKLAWKPCGGGMQCATARVPLDYRQPGGAKITIQLIRHLATDPAHRIGSLFINIGGPSEQV